MDASIRFRTGADRFSALPAVEVAFFLLEIINGGVVLLICNTDK